MKRYADSIARQLGIKPPAGYKTSISICGAFLRQHAPKKASGDSNEAVEAKPVSSAQLSYARKIAIAKGIVVPDEAKTNSVAMAAWLDSNKGAKRPNGHRKAAVRTAGTSSSRSITSPKRVRKSKTEAPADAAPTTPNSATATPLRIPYGNKEVALKLGARYRSGGWFAPPGTDLAGFSERGWL
jgi:DNA topoisomerase-3